MEDIKKGLESEMPMKEELKNSAKRHAHRLIKKMQELEDVPSVVQDSIRREMEYATMDGYRITMKHISEKEEYDEDSYGNR